MADFFEDDINEQEDEDIITLHNYETDKDEDFYHLATLDVNKRWYIVMQPVEPVPDIGEDEVLIYEIVTDSAGESTFKPIEDEEELQTVFDEFIKELEKYDGECDCCDHEHCDHDGCDHDACCEGGVCHFPNDGDK